MRHRNGPMLVLIGAIAGADVVFAMDSIPAVFGLTRDPYLVLAANVFALLGLRHLYFLIGGLLLEPGRTSARDCRPSSGSSG